MPVRSSAYYQTVGALFGELYDVYDASLERLESGGHIIDLCPAGADVQGPLERLRFDQYGRQTGGRQLYPGRPNRAWVSRRVTAPR